jgi:hypothetical protein
MMASSIVDFFVEDASWSFALDMLYCVALLLVVVMMFVRYKAEKKDLLFWLNDVRCERQKYLSTLKDLNTMFPWHYDDPADDEIFAQFEECHYGVLVKSRGVPDCYLSKDLRLINKASINRYMPLNKEK